MAGPERLGESLPQTPIALDETNEIFTYQNPLTGLNESVAIDSYNNDDPVLAAQKAKMGMTLVSWGCGGETAIEQSPVVEQSTETQPAWTNELQDTLVVATGADYSSVIPVTTRTATDQTLMSMTNYPATDGRVYAPGDHPTHCGLVQKSALAKDWTWTDDTTLVVNMRGDIRWADNPEEFIDEEDWRFTYELVNDPLVASDEIGYFQKVEGRQPNFETLDDGTVRLTFRFETTVNKDLYESRVMAMRPVPYHLLKDADRKTINGSGFNKNPVGSGRWQIETVDPGKSITLVPNPNFTGDNNHPHLKRIKIRILPEYATQLVELETGGLDYIDGLNIPDMNRLRREHPEIKIHAMKNSSMDYVAWNLLDREDYQAKKAAAEERGETLDIQTVKPNKLFSDVKVRQALAHGVDAQKIIDDLLSETRRNPETGETEIIQSYGRRTVSTIAPFLCDAYNDEITPFAFDPALASSLLSEAGWEDTNGNGTIDKMIDGALVEFSFTLSTNVENLRRNRAAIIMQAQLKELGIDMQIERVEFNRSVENLGNRNFDAALSGWRFGTMVDPSFAWGPDSQRNYPSFIDPELSKALEIYESHPDAETREQALRDAQRIIYEAQPYLFLYNRDKIVGVHERFQWDGEGPMFSPRQDFSAAHDWYVDPEDVKYKR